MLKKFVEWLAQNPIAFNVCRRIIEFNYWAIKKTIIKEFYLCQTAGSSNTNNNKHQRILDVPCGTGEFCMLFEASSYTGIDISQKYVDYARKTYKRNFFCRDARQTGFENFYFDKVLIIGFFHHLDDVSVKTVLKETKRILKKTGQILIIEDDPTSPNWDIIGKFLKTYDRGSRSRSDSVYKDILRKDFIIRKYYPLKSGFWDYSVFVLSPNKVEGQQKR